MRVGDVVKISKYYKKVWRPFPYDDKEYSKVTQDNLVCNFKEFKKRYKPQNDFEYFNLVGLTSDVLKDAYSYEGYQEKWFRVCATDKMVNDGEYYYQRFKTIKCDATGIVGGQRILTTKGSFSHSYHYDGSEFLQHIGEQEKFYLVAINLNKMVLVKASEVSE